MKIKVNAPAETLSQFDTLSSAVIDSSSIIYLQKINVLSKVIGMLKLHTVENVISECDFEIPKIIIIESTVGDTTDKQIVDSSKALALPVISDDFSILQKVSMNNLPHYNSLMILNFVLYKNDISTDEYIDYLFELKQIARYSSFVWKYGEDLFRIIEKQR
jgi:hypothetical protein